VDGVVDRGCYHVSLRVLIGERRISPMNTRSILRLEGAGLFAASTVAYFSMDGPLWLFLVLALAPDVSMAAYLAGPRAGSRLYNAFHTYLAPLSLLGVGVGLGATPLSWIALVWAAHVGADRAVGYGLKRSTGFKHTHLSPDADRGPPVVGPGPVVTDGDGGND
jgi:hypothetical protein